jgi:hypothetical protein
MCHLINLSFLDRELFRILKKNWKCYRYIKVVTELIARIIDPFLFFRGFLN